MSADEALEHKWIAGDAASTSNLICPSNCTYVASLKQYQYGNKLQRILVDAIISEMDCDERELMNEGLLNMQRNQSEVKGDNVVDYLVCLFLGHSQ